MLFLDASMPNLEKYPKHLAFSLKYFNGKYLSMLALMK